MPGGEEGREGGPGAGDGLPDLDRDLHVRELDLPVVDASTKVVMPGIVAVDSDLTAVRDSDYQITPDAIAIDAFDFERSWRRALEGGITSAYVSPSRQRLVSGQGSVVRLAGADIVERLLVGGGRGPGGGRVNLSRGPSTVPMPLRRHRRSRRGMARSRGLGRRR